MFDIIGGISKRIQHILLWTGFALFYLFSMSCLLPFPFEFLLIDSLVHAAFGFLLGLILSTFFRFVNLAVLPKYLRILNVCIIVLVFVGFSEALAYLLLSLFVGTPDLSYLLPVLPVRFLIGFLISSLLICYFLFDQVVQRDRVQNEGIMSTVEEGIESIKNISSVSLEQIAIKSGSKIDMVRVSDVLYIQANGDYVLITSKEGRFLKEQTMKYFQEQLSPVQFVRVHRSCIVNINAILRIERHNKQLSLVMQDKCAIKVSVVGYKILQDILKL